MRNFTQLIGVGLVLLLSFSPLKAEDFNVKFVRFELDQVGKVVTLKWGTQSEFNNEMFTVQRSNNVIDWTNLDDVTPVGTTPGAGDYSFSDTQPVDGWNYYRIRQTDFNGDVSYSDVKKILVMVFNEDDVVVTPNPSSDDVFTIETDGLIGNPQVELIDIAGKALKINTVQNDTSIKVQVTSSIPGLYFLILRFADQQIVKKVSFK